MKGRYFPKKETNASLFEVEPQVEYIHLPRYISRTPIRAVTRVYDQVMGQSVNCMTGRKKK